MAELTLSIDDDVISRAEEYARNKGTSIASLVENYLGAITDPPARPVGPTPVLDYIAGFLEGVDASDYKEYRIKKYL